VVIRPGQHCLVTGPNGGTSGAFLVILGVADAMCL